MCMSMYDSVYECVWYCYTCEYEGVCISVYTCEYVGVCISVYKCECVMTIFV